MHAFVNALIRLPGGIRRRIRVFVWRSLGANIGRRCWIEDVWIPRNPWDVEIRNGAALDRHVTLLTTGAPVAGPRIIIGERCYVNRRTFIDASERIVIGPECMIGPDCYITDHDHGMAAGQPISQQPLISAPVEIGAGAWLGARVVVLKGASIGEGAVVGAGSVVTRLVEPFAVVVGVPARRIRFR